MFRLLPGLLGGDFAVTPMANSVSFPAGTEAAGELWPASGPEQRAYHAILAIYDFRGYTNAGS
jgi:hypothetical protein